MKSSREMRIASKKRAMSETSTGVDDENSSSDFEASSNAKPVTKRRRTAKTSSTNAEPAVVPKPADVFAKGSRGEAWKSKEGHPIGSLKWMKEIFARDSVWNEMKKLPKGILTTRLTVNIAADLNTTTVTTPEKPKSHPRSRPAIKAASAVIDLSDQEIEPELGIEDVASNQNPNILVPNSICQSQQQALDLLTSGKQNSASMQEGASDDARAEGVNNDGAEVKDGNGDAAGSAGDPLESSKTRRWDPTNF